MSWEKLLRQKNTKRLQESRISHKEVFYATGGRLSEVQGLDKKDVDWQDSSARVVGHHRKVKF
jgi:site-specific recombinase XerC